MDIVEVVRVLRAEVVIGRPKLHHRVTAKMHR